MKKIIKIGTRPSKLALRQVEEIRNLFPQLEPKVVIMETQGDKDKITPLYKVKAADFFTREIDNTLLAGEIDMAVHSSKDLPDILPKGLAIAFQTPPLSPYDALVSKGNLKLRELAKNWRIGISSQRRKEQLCSLRKDLKIVDVRGNIEERLALIDIDKIDALIVAHAALLRLGLENRISEVFPLNVFNTHPKQGSLSIVVREDEKDIIRLCRKFLSQPNG